MESQDLKKFNLPDGPGVYFFLGNKPTEILYIGKATSLRDRVRSYFNGDLGETRGPKIVQMLKLADSLKWQETDSVLEALILEAALIKKHQPPYNTREKDDKSYWLVVVTKENFPRVLMIRKRELEKGPDSKTSKNKYAVGKIFGPFPYASELKTALKIIRRIFPFRDTCVPLVEKLGKESADHAKAVRGCFNYQIGLCPGVCTGKISKTDYGKIIKRLTLFFEGKKEQVIKSLGKEMQVAAKSQNFEAAGRLRDQIFSLRHIQDVSLLKKTEEKTRQEAFRLEAYDVAHFASAANVGAMVVWENGELNKNEYRLFKLRGPSAKKGDDLANLTEVLHRRFDHQEWPKPALIVLDGGQAQLRAAEKVLADKGLKIPVVAVTKDEKHKAREIIGAGAEIKKYERAIILANADVHRFVLAYHRKIMRQMLK